jgi:hypothetical protein
MRKNWAILIVLAVFSKNTLLHSQDFKINSCEIAGSDFNYLDNGQKPLKYIGSCENNLANGWGTLYFASGLKWSAFFDNNLITDNYIQEHTTNSKFIYFGANKGIRKNGILTHLYEKTMVGISSFSDGNNVSDDFFKTDEPTSEINLPFCLPDALFPYEYIKVPGTERCLFFSAKEYNQRGDRKYWISLVDVRQNKLVFNYGNFSQPIRTATWERPEVPVFVGFGPNSEYALFNIRGNLNEAPKYLKCNLNNGSTEIVSKLPQSIANEIVHFQKIRERIPDSNVSETVIIQNSKIKPSWMNPLQNNHFLMGDSSYFKGFNGSSDKAQLVHFDKNHNLLNKLLINDLKIVAYDINETVNRIAILVHSKDSTFINFYDLRTFKMIAKSYSVSGNIFSSYFSFSKSGSFLSFSFLNDHGTLILDERGLNFAVPGSFVILNSNENVILSNCRGDLRAFDLDRKRILWQYKIDDDIWNTQTVELNNDIAFIYRPRVLVGNQYERKKEQLMVIKNPKSPINIKDFIVNIERQKNSISEISKNSTGTVNNTSNPTLSISKTTHESNSNSENDKERPSVIIKTKRKTNSSSGKCVWCSGIVTCSRKTEEELKFEETLAKGWPGQMAVLFQLSWGIRDNLVDNGNGTFTYIYPINLYDCPSYCSLKCEYEHKKSGYKN